VTLILFTLLGISPRAAPFQEADQKALLTLKVNGDYTLSPAFSPDGKSLVSLGREIRVWDVDRGRNTASFHESHVIPMCVAFCPDGKTIATGNYDGKIMIWNVQTRRWQLTLPGHSDPAEYVAFSRDGKILASASWGDNAEQTIKLWDPASGKRHDEGTGMRFQCARLQPRRQVARLG
jgi:WD40 repeat protein